MLLELFQKDKSEDSVRTNSKIMSREALVQCRNTLCLNCLDNAIKPILVERTFFAISCYSLIILQREISTDVRAKEWVWLFFQDLFSSSHHIFPTILVLATSNGFMARHTKKLVISEAPKCTSTLPTPLLTSKRPVERRNRFDKSYELNWTALPIPVRTMAASTPLQSPLKPSFSYTTFNALTVPWLT